jgi:trimeric autotransporter adhesin
MAMNKSRRTSNINNIVQYDTSGNVTIPQIDNANIDTDEFLVSDNGTIKFRTGSEVLSDIGAQGAITLTTTGTTGAATLIGSTLNIPQYVTGAGFVPVGRQLTINGVTYDLSADRTWSITAGVSSVAGTAPINAANVSGAVTISIDQADTDTDGYLSSVDWNTFNGKQPAGSYITGLTGEVTASGPGSVAATISNAAVIAKVLTGLSITGSAITSGDSILGAMGKLQNQINGLTGSLIYKGSWNAATNTPTINSGVGIAGNFYIVTTAGSTTIDGVSSWAVGDWIIFSGAVWQKVPNTNTVVSVNSYTGAVVLTTDDINEDASPTNLWFTEARAQAAIIGAASTITTTNLTINRALVSNSSGKIVVSTTTSTELGYVAGVTSAIQTQLDGKEPSIAAGTVSQYWRGDKSWQTLPVYTFNSLSPMTTLGDIIYGGASGAGTRLAGNTTTSRRFLRQTGTGSASAAPAWDGLVAGDIPNNTAQSGYTEQSVTFVNNGTGAAAPVSFNGGTARTISYNTIGAQPASSNLNSLAGLTYTSSAIVRMTGANTFTLDTASYQPILNGTGFVKASGTSITYDNSTYLTTSSAASTYLTISTAASTYQPIGSYVTGSATLGYYPITSGSTTNIATSSLTEVSGITRNVGNGFITGVSNGYWFGTSTTGVTGMSGYGTSNTLVLYAGSSERIMIHNSGRVFINSTSDVSSSYQLQVNGATYSSGGFFESSDITLKDVIAKSDSDTFGAIEYKWKDERDSKVHWGYSAQDVQRWIPDAVELGSDGSLSLDYNQAHSWKIMQLENKIKELEAKLAK